MTACVNADLFRLAYYAVSTEATRYYLNGVHIEAHPVAGAIMVATDGGRMVIIHDAEGTCDAPCIIKLPRFALAQCKTPKLFKAKRQIVVEGDSATIREVTPPVKKADSPTTVSIVTAHRVSVDGTFPDWRRVVPSGEPPKAAEATSFQAKYLKDWGAFGVDLAAATGCSGEMQIKLSDGNSPVVIRWAGANNVLGVQMPMRSSIDGRAIPTFLAAAPVMQAAE